jgi:AraC-like DNA-binding protein
VGCGQEKFQDRLVVVFLHHGSFQLRREGRAAVVDANVVAYFNPLEPFTTTHPFGCGDCGCSLVVEPSLLAEILEEHAPASLDARGPLFPLGFGCCPPHAYLLQSRLVAYLRSDRNPDALLVEESALQLAGEVIARPIRAAASGSADDERRRRSAAEVVEEIKRQLLMHLETGIPLQELASAVGYSPFTVCRIFKRATGMPIHRYLTALRLRAAIGAIAESSDLTRLALDLGYSSHSHFTAKFRREFGLTPSALRSGHGSEAGLRPLP